MCLSGHILTHFLVLANNTGFISGVANMGVEEEVT